MTDILLGEYRYLRASDHRGGPPSQIFTSLLHLSICVSVVSLLPIPFCSKERVVVGRRWLSFAYESPPYDMEYARRAMYSIHSDCVLVRSSTHRPSSPFCPVCPGMALACPASFLSHLSSVFLSHIVWIACRKEIEVGIVVHPAQSMEKERAPSNKAWGHVSRFSRVWPT